MELGQEISRLSQLSFKSSAENRAVSLRFISTVLPSRRSVAVEHDG